MVEKIKSPLIDLSVVTEEMADETAFITYQKYLEKVLREIEKANKKYGNKITVDYVVNVDTGGNLFETVVGPKPKITLQMGNENAQKKILIVGGSTHGTESRVARATLEAVLELAKPGEAREELLANNHITIDPVVDPSGFNDQTWGTVTRDGRQVNAPIVGGLRGHSDHVKGPAYQDRNVSQGRLSTETLDVLSRSNQAHYKKVGKCNRFLFALDLHETNELSHYPELFHHYAGVDLIFNFFCSAEQLAVAQRLPSEILASGMTKAIKRISAKVWEKILGTEQPRFCEDVFALNLDVAKFKLIRDRIRALGERTFEKDYEKVAQTFSGPMKQCIRLGESIEIMSELYTVANFICTPEALAYKGLTTETMQQDLAVRISQSLAAIEAVLWVECLGKLEVGK